jgi:acyl carrier protein
VHVAYGGLNAAGQLVAAVRADPGTELAALRARLRSALPDYLVPSHIAVLDRLPLTANGKVDIAGLLSGVGQDTRPATANEPAGSALSWVIDLWSAVLGVTASADTDFFAAGGDSLRLLRVLTHCRNEFGVELRPTVLFDNATPRDFAMLLAGERR